MSQSTAYVRVRVGDERYALSVEHVLEIVDLGTVTPVPGSRDAVLGVHVLHGEVIAAADLAAVLGIANEGPSRRLVVAAQGTVRRAALAVDEVLGVGELGELSPEPEGNWVTATAMVEGALVGVLDVNAVFDAIGGGVQS
jgi:purine-binding chemotaxis protein CheW